MKTAESDSVISYLDSRVLDINSEALGTTIKELMNNAGEAISKILNERHPDKKILFVCGTGNNGGDGFSAALKMNPADVKIALLKKASRIHSDESRYYYSLLECEIENYSKLLLDKYDVIVDCALGTGISGTVLEPYKSFIEDANRCQKTIVSIDVPSGFGTDCSIHPSMTITFHDCKCGMTKDSCGDIIIADIGIPENASAVVGPGDMLRYPIPNRDSHKGQNGRLMIIAGGPYYGAPIMSGLAALRTGADIVRIFAPSSIAPIISASSPVLMITKLDGDHLAPASLNMLLSESVHYDAVLIGPGLGTHEETIIAIREFVSKCDVPMVIDADGITAIVGLEKLNNCILTPHSREYVTIAGNKDVMAASKSLGCTILKKGSKDIISNGDKMRINHTGTPAMTGAGTGDVLAGIVSALLSKGMTAFDSACLGAYISGKAGEYSFDKRSYGSIATDIIEEIPHVLKKYLR